MVSKESSKESVSKASWLLYMAAFGSLLGGVSIGLAMGYASPAIPSMEKDFSHPHYDHKKDQDIESWIQSVPTLGGMFGAFSGGFLSGIRGTRTCLMANCIPFLIGWLLVGVASNTSMIIVGRLITGVCCGIFTSSLPTFLNEISPLSLRGMLGTGFQISCNVGVLIPSILGMFVEWEMLALLSTIPSIAMPIILYFSPESPVYMFNKYGASKETLKTLQQLRSADSDCSEELNLMAQAPQERQPIILSWKQIKKPVVYKPLIYTWTLLILVHLMGLNAIIFNEKIIFIMSGIKLDADVCCIILNSLAVLATLVSAALAGKVGRKTILLISGIGNFVSMVGLSFCFLLSTKVDQFGERYGAFVLLFTIGFLSFFMFGWGPIPWVIGPELCPYFARGFILSAGASLNWFVGFIVPKEFGALEHAITPAGTYLAFALMCMVGVVFTLIFVPETRGKTNAEILELFERPSSDETVQKTFKQP